MSALPWLKWRPDKWRNDKPLQTCSLAARGLWHELCMIAHDCEPYGYVRIAGTVPDLAALAKLVGSKPSETKKLLAELERIKVFSRASDGAIFSRRMVKDEAARLQAAADGKRGGNPSLTEMDKGGDKGHAKGPLVRALARSEESESLRDQESEREERKSQEYEHPPSPRTRGAIFDLDAALVSHPALNTPAFRCAWADMTQHRHEMRVKALTPTGSRGRLRDFAALGHDRAVAAIRHSIANGYQGVFEPGQNGHKAQQPAAVGRATPADWKALQPSDEQLRNQREELRRIDELWGNKRKAVATTAPGIAAESESA